MATLKARLEKLEAKLIGVNAPHRIIAVKGGHSGSDGAVEAYLAGQRVHVTSADQIVYIRTTFEDPNGEEMPPVPFQLLNITPYRGRL